MKETFKQYVKRFWESDDIYSSEKATRAKLKSVETALKNLLEGKRTAQSVIGNGCKDPNPVAKGYLIERIEEYKEQIRTNGESNSILKNNFLSQAKKHNLNTII